MSLRKALNDGLYIISVRIDVQAFSCRRWQLHNHIPGQGKVCVIVVILYSHTDVCSGHSLAVAIAEFHDCHNVVLLFGCFRFPRPQSITCIWQIYWRNITMRMSQMVLLILCLEL